jgi:hypothetical protein
MSHKSRKNKKDFMFRSVGWPLLRFRELKASSVTWTFFMEARGWVN